MQHNGDLSVEEILESIKKVIARDNKETAQIERHRRENEGVILRGPGAALGVMPLAASGNDDEPDEEEVFDLEAAMMAESDESTDLDVEAPSEPVEPAAHEDETAESREEAPEPIAQEPAPSEPQPETVAAMPETAPETAETITESPIERMVRESLRPMLREWLDENLPPLVERIVKEELASIMGKPR